MSCTPLLARSVALLCVLGVPVAGQSSQTVAPERPGLPPSPYVAKDPSLPRSQGLTVSEGPYVSRQVNVDGNGDNIVGDAANEPSITVDPNDSDVLAIGWRQFDSITSDFREAGWSWSHDGGLSWTFPGVLEEGVFRSDPVLAATNDGDLFYQSLSLNLLGDIEVQVFRSTDGGVTWGPPVEEFGGDKNWIVADNTGGPGEGFLYGIWQPFFDCCLGLTLTRSVDGGASFEFPVESAGRPLFGIMDVGPDGTLYMAGAEGTLFQDLDTLIVSRSSDAQIGGASPTSAFTVVDMGGGLSVGVGPNPSGLVGQMVVATDHSSGPFAGAVYLLGSVDPSGGFGTGPVEVRIARSDDGGVTFGPSVRVNDDPLGNGAWHWLATMDVAPNGRLDAVWYDTRDSGVDNISRLYYAWSHDGGATWSDNVPASPSFDSHAGWPVQQKMGDYTTMVSQDTYADVAYAATFNGEQDVFHVKVFPLGSFVDLGLGLAGVSGLPELTGSGTLQGGTAVSLSLSNARALAPAGLFLGFTRIDAPFKGGVLVPAADFLVDGLTTDAGGELTVSSTWPVGLPPGFELYAQVWLQDAAGPKGLAASNGLLAVTP
jgi:hypothetical protein